MSGGGSSSRVSIPSNMKKMIQNIKEITGNHSEDEIYSMLKECSMDPNETAQRLLLQDPFHEVKRKRGRRKENVKNREPIESRQRPGLQGRGSRGGRVNFSHRYPSHDADCGKNSVTGRDNGISQVAEKGTGLSLPTSQDTKNKETTPAASFVTVMANGPSGVASGSTSVVNTSDLPAGSGVNQPEVSSSAVGISELGSAPSNVYATKNSTLAFGTGPTQGQPAAISSTPSSSTACFSSSDPVLVPSNDSRLSGAVVTIKREVGSHQTPSELTATSEIGISCMHGKMPRKFQGVVKPQLTESSQPSSVSVPIHNVSLVSRPPSNYSSRSQEIVGSHKVGSNKEWKPKLTNSNAAQGSGIAATSEVPTVIDEATARLLPVSSSFDTEEAASKLQKKLGELHLPQRQHVIIPNHIHVPESERTKLSFGSFDASFGVASNYVGGQESEKSSTAVSETSQVIEETVEGQAASNQNMLTTAEVGDYPDHPQSPTHVPENLSGEGVVSDSVVPEFIESRQETALLSGGQQYSMVHTSPNYSFGFLTPILGSQFAFENSDSQTRDASRLPGFVVQQPFDPASFYAQFYRSGADGDGRLSPFTSPGVATKYNGNVAVLPPQTSPSPQEGGNSLVLSTAGPTPLVTQAAGHMQSSIAVTQQPVPVFRSPIGMHIPHYPPNYIPYGPYFPPFYGPPPAIHQFLSNGAFPQQPQAGSVYPSPLAAAAAGAKFSLPQYKPGTNTGNSTHIGMPSGYASYGSSPAGYTPSSAAAAGNSTANEDLGASQFKESNIYMTGQQSEGSSLPASSFYNLPPQGQHMTFAPTQAGYGTFTGMYHPAQAVTAATVHPLLQQSQTMAGAVEMGGPAASVYQQPQHAQINWPSNY